MTALTSTAPAALPSPHPGALAAARPRGLAGGDCRGAIRAGFLIIAVTFGGLGGWAALAPLKSAVMGAGMLKVESNRKDVQHLEGGIVKELLVTEGAFVHAGDPLLRLDETNALAQRDILRGQLDAGQALEARLLAERDELPAIAFPEALRGRGGEANVHDILAGQAALFERRRTSRDGQVAMLHKRVAQYKEEIIGIDAQQRSKGDQLRLIEDELKGTLELQAKGYAPKTRVLALQREAARLRGEQGEHISTIARARQAIGETEIQILQISNKFREDVATELRQAQNDIYSARERLAAVEDTLKRATLVAPQDGTVVGMNIHTVGGIIQPGRTLMQIVPAADRLIVEARVPITDIDRVRAGLPAALHFSAFHDRTVPTIEGTVQQVSADRLTDEHTGMPYYMAEVAVEPDAAQKLGEHKMLPGMPVEVMIQTGAQTTLSYLISPFTDMILKSFNEH